MPPPLESEQAKVSLFSFSYSNLDSRETSDKNLSRVSIETFLTNAYMLPMLVFDL